MAFTEQDLDELASFLKLGVTETVPYIEVARGTAPPGSVALRHDVDHSIDKAVRFAEWEYSNGLISSYYILHSAEYWDGSDHFYEQVREIVRYGHEIGLHNDALCEADGDIAKAAELIKKYTEELQDAIGNHYHILGVADHGGSPHTNGDIWDYYVPKYFGFEYEAYQLQKEANTYISDNQGRWRSPRKLAQTFMLVHPTWWPV